MLAICLTVLLCFSSIGGCMYQIVDQDDIANAIDACKDKEGVFEIKEGFGGITEVTCKNGKRLNIDARKIADEET